MENIFNFNRFWLLVRNHAKESWKLFILFIVIATMPAIFIYLIENKPAMEEVYGFYIIILILIGGIYLSMFFKDWSNTARSSSFLTMPVTALEKIALVLFYSVILFIPAFTIVYYYSCMIMSNILHPEIIFTIKKYFEFRINGIYDNHPILAITTGVIMPYVFVHSLFLLSTVWFKKMQLLKGLAGIVILFFVFYFWYHYYFQIMIGSDKVDLKPYDLFPKEIYYRDSEYGFTITSHILTNISMLLYTIIPVIIYVATYFKLKEKEI